MVLRTGCHSVFLSELTLLIQWSLTCRARGQIWICLTYTVHLVKDAYRKCLERGDKTQLGEASVAFSRPICRWVTLCVGLLTEALPKPVGSNEVKLSVPFWSYSFNVKMRPYSDETAAVAAAMLISLAAAIVYNSRCCSFSLLVLCVLSEQLRASCISLPYLPPSSAQTTKTLWTS